MGSKDCAPKQVDVTKKRQHSIEFAMAKIHETFNTKHKSGWNFEKKEYRKPNGDYWCRTWPASICPDTIPGYTVIQNFRPDRGCWPFQKFCQFCPDWLLAFFKNLTKSVWIVTKPPHWLGSSQHSETTPGSLFISPWCCWTCPKVCLVSLVTDLLSESRISDKWSQVTPLSESIEMVKY